MRCLRRGGIAVGREVCNARLNLRRIVILILRSLWVWGPTVGVRLRAATLGALGARGARTAEPLACSLGAESETRERALL